MDYIGNVAVPEIAVSGVFPIVSDMGWGQAWEPEVAVHQFGSGDAKIEQRFLLGAGSKQFTVRKAALRDSDRILLRDFWESHSGPLGSFYYDAPSDDGAGVTRYVCRFAVEPLSWQMLTDWVCTTGVKLIEIPVAPRVLALAGTLTRFPDSDLQDALLAQAQEIIPLIKITPRSPILLSEPVETPQAPIIIQGNTRPWNVGVDYGANPAHLSAPGYAGSAAPEVVATGLTTGEQIVFPAITGRVAYTNAGFGSYPSADPAGDMSGSYGGGDKYAVLQGGFYFPSHYAALNGLGLAALVGAFTDDAGIVIEVVAVGYGGTFTCPAGATRFQLGINRVTDYSEWWGNSGGTHFTIPFPSITTPVAKEAVDYPAIYLSDRRVTIGAQLYQARLLKWDGISQGMAGESDDAQFTFGNADRVMRHLANDVDLYRAVVEFALFHVQTGVQLDIWKGEIIDWTLDQGPEFQVSAADGLYELRLPYPTRKICRTCWKMFADGLGCVWAGVLTGAADRLWCDKGFSTPNGCDAHGMAPSFGGVVAQPQGVRIKDNSSGMWGFSRSKITSLSLIADSIYDQVVQEIYTDAPMPVAGKIAAGRDESDFFDALALIGEGPLEFADPYTKPDGTKVGHTLDGQFWHGYPNPDMGLRCVDGNDPATDAAHDCFSVSRVGSDPGAGEITDSGSVVLRNFAAGTAFLEIRRSDAKGLQLTRPDEHAVQAIIATGLKGWVWTAAGARTWATLTNPVWIVVNMLLKARGLRYADAATAEGLFDVVAAVASAAVCDTAVDKLVGAGTETQFKFRGVLQEEKPLKDWIEEILMNCMGYYVWADGKLKVGLRTDATSVEDFSEGNILFGSLQLSPLKPAFNHLTASFADDEFDFVANSITVYDEDHARLVGGATSPLFLKSNANLAGTSIKSQAARIVSMRLREELGGTTYTQWKTGRNVAFKTTVLALTTEPGQVATMLHDDMPAGDRKFRTQSWRLNQDYSIEIQGRSVVDEMYDLAEAGAAAVDVPLEATTLDTPADQDFSVPVAPTFDVTAPGDGTVVLAAPTFADTTNTLTIEAATWTFRFWNALSAASTITGGISDVVPAMVVASAAGLALGDFLQLDRECVKITSIAGTTIGIARAQLGTAAAAHLAAAVVRRLSALASTQTPDTFGVTVSLDDACIASAQCSVRNAFGAGAVATNNYLGEGTGAAPGRATGKALGDLYLINGA